MSWFCQSIGSSFVTFFSQKLFNKLELVLQSFQSFSQLLTGINKNYEIVFKLIQEISNVNITKLFISNYNFNVLINFYNRIEEIIFEHMPVKKININNDKYDSYLRIVDALGYLKSVLLAQFILNLNEFDEKKIVNKINEINWGKENKIITLGFPQFLHSELLYLNKTIQYEIDIHGKRLSPDWYILSILFLKFSEEFYNAYIQIFKFIAHQLDILNKKNVLKIALEEKWTNLYVCCYLNRILEQTQNLHRLNYQFKIIFENFHSFSKVDSLVWPNYDSNHFENELSKFEVSLTEEVSKLSSIFNINQFPLEYPDYGGKFLHLVGNNILRDIIEKKFFSKNTYSMFQRGSFVMYDKLNTDLRKYDKVNEIQMFNYIVSPIVDLIALSGLVFILSEFLNKNEYKKVIKECWDNYLLDNFEQKIINISEFIQLHKSIFMGFKIPHRNIHRFNWHENIFKFFLKELEITECIDFNRDEFGFLKEKKINHKSDLIRLLVSKYINNGTNVNDGINVFIVFYLKDKFKSLNLQSKDLIDLDDIEDIISEPDELNLKRKDE